MSATSTRVLFGGPKRWVTTEWTASDDRVRGGKSESYLRLLNDGEGENRAGGRVVFGGVLDIETLGGAGFASQRTVEDHRRWDLSSYDGLQIVLDPSQSDRKRYTLILKDEILPINPENGREQATTSWEYDFDLDSTSHEEAAGTDPLTCVFVPWNELQPTYRGKKIEPKRPLDVGNVRRFSIMMRSFFGTQDGPFSLCLVKISAMHLQPAMPPRFPHPASSDGDSLAEKRTSAGGSQRRAWHKMLAACCLSTV